MLDKVQTLGLTTFLIAQFSLSSLYSPLIFLGWMGLGVAVFCKFLSTEQIFQPRWVLAALIVLQGSQLAGIAGAALWGTGNWVLTAGVVLWAIPMPLVYVAANRHVGSCFLIFAVVHAVVIIIEGLTNYYVERGITIWEGSVTGFSHNANLAAGLLIMALPFAMKDRWQWAWVPLLMAMVFTGSRWAFIVALFIIVAMNLTSAISLRGVIMAGFSFIGAVVLMQSFTPATAEIAGVSNFGHLSAGISDILVRLNPVGWPNLLPYGLAETSGLHNVPMRIAAEYGVIAAVIWVTLTIWALTRMRGTPAWWLMLTISLLSMLDHYTWRPHLMGLWFLALGLLAASPTRGRLELSGIAGKRVI
jgi:hypothetical protein